jgi:hypothetical protein
LKADIDRRHSGEINPFIFWYCMNYMHIEYAFIFIHIYHIYI